MLNYETIIGIEVHAQLNTKRKIFSPSLNDMNSAPNTNVHPIDLGMPGALPQFNEEVLQKALLITKAFDMDVTKSMHWDRKNYFYHDNPKGYQITQFETPIGRNGKIQLDNGKVIEIDFMHMEEDTAKSFHGGVETKLDFNRCGIPLVEIVSKPDLRSAAEAKEFLEKLRQTLLYLGVSDCKMEEGSLRVDVNISVRPYGQEFFNPKVEIKNLNSFSNVVSAIQLEEKAQIKNLNEGNATIQATKRYLEATKQVQIMRIKETATDYRYFSEPDLPNIQLTDEYIAQATSNMPLLPHQIVEKLEKSNITKKEIDVLLLNVETTHFYLELLAAGLDAKKMINYMLSNVNEYLNKSNSTFSELKITVENFKDIQELVDSGKISSAHVKKLIPMLCEEEHDVKALVKELGIEQIVDRDEITALINNVLDANQESVTDYLEGKNKAFGFLIGQILKASNGQAHPGLVNEILKAQLTDRAND